MTIRGNLGLTINGTVISYENNGVEITSGKVTRVANPQVNGNTIITTDISSAFSTIKVTVRVTEESNDIFDQFYDNGDNNIITYGDKNYSRCFLEVLPPRVIQDTVDYTFFGNPEI